MSRANDDFIQDNGIGTRARIEKDIRRSIACIQVTARRGKASAWDWLVAKKIIMDHKGISIRAERT